MSKESYQKNKIVIPNCPRLLVGEKYTEIKAWQVKFAYSDPYFYEKLRWNKSVTAKVSLENLEMLWNDTSFKNRTFKSAVWY